MKRAIVQPPNLSGAALAELKQWLGITTDSENELLAGLLQASLALCESFIGQMPIEAICEEQLPVGRGWQALASGPVRAITKVELVGDDGSRSSLLPEAYEIDIDANGTGRVRIAGSPSARAVVVSFVPGLVPEWSALPDSLRHGIVRLAAFQYRDRDAEEPARPPASVTALWQPWRKVRLA